MSTWTTEIEAKWQAKWYAAKINEAERDNRPKFMIIFAYPGLTGYLHVGHMRGYTYVDAIGRYKRMCGFNVMFPLGTHATGNGAISLAKRIKAHDPKTIEYLIANGCPEDMIPNLTEPMDVVNFFNQVYQDQYWRRFGFLADWRRFTSTTNPDYQMFIQWQFRKLNDAGLLIQKPYFAPACVECGPVAIDASETDLSKGGSAETTEYTLLKFKYGDMFLVAATLRPETVYGQTNFWVNPDVEYVKVRRGDETWVISRPSYEKMIYQKDGLELIGTVKGSELVGKEAVAPVIHRPIPVLPATFAKPEVGTGLVTSVPSDAPDDWMALLLLQRDEQAMARYGLDPEKVRAIKPIPIINTKGYGPMPAVEMIERMGITEGDDPRLNEAKKQIYKDGFHTGRMNETCAEFAGLRVDEAKELIKKMMIENGEAEVFYDLSEEVVCRCGKPVVIKKVPDQWFIDYGNVALTEATKAHCKTMHIIPPEFYTNVQGILDWFRERACVRQGNWLGTPFPFDPKWIIEAISDSTLYPIYYTISNYCNSGQIRPEQLTEEFFDLVFLGKGAVPDVAAATGIDESLLSRIRDDVRYFYPLDINLGGKEHMTVHFPAFLKNHVAILPPEFWPRGIFVNWYITGKLGKISKSKGGAEPIPDAAERFGVDALRLYYAHIAAPFADVEWDEGVVENYASRIERIMRTIEEMKGLTGTESKTIDKWLISRMNNRAGTIAEAMNDYDLRRMANETYFETLADVRWYMRRGGNNSGTVAKVLSMWIRMMAPITPHIAEELWEGLGEKGFVSIAPYPEPDNELIDSYAEVAETYLVNVMSDINEILRVTGISPKRVILYTAPEWKRDVLSIGLELASGGQLTIPALTKAVMSRDDLKRRGKEAAEFARKIAEDLMRRADGERKRLSIEVDELSYLTESAAFLSKEVGATVEVYSADDASAPDPQKKARAAQPRRPAIYVE
ncbi:MAG: leucine--tRNA ligase [Methanomassiliicoccaceae archaeon]|jgi:leucyl-tRNA synthetase|nr:leucine--tRNA ligase [Euryarchaeota archaeon]HOB37496.1 leucine--tRNA ligase [Methanomassiliicoccaceae archaeon]HQA21950.1 leucine--tRNA ligase [Methanomassiliicoccaceae archaeon]HQD87727.1 leucine--tRNA ligase [Methanomassiliicoccaceae archaeon]